MYLFVGFLFFAGIQTSKFTFINVDRILTKEILQQRQPSNVHSFATQLRKNDPPAAAATVVLLTLFSNYLFINALIASCISMNDTTERISQTSIKNKIQFLPAHPLYTCTRNKIQLCERASEKVLLCHIYLYRVY